MRKRVLLLGAVGLAVLCLVLVGVLRRGGAASYKPVPLSGPLAQEINPGSVVAPTPRPISEVSAPAPSPSEAVRLFVAAEVEQRFAASFRLLSREDRESYGRPESWRQAHHELPRLVSSGPLDGAGGDVVVSEVVLEPRLDRIVGAVPASARISWQTVPEDGGWRVAYTDSIVEAHFPDDSGADDAVMAWADAAQRCADTGSLEARSGLVGVTGYAKRLCDAPGLLSVGAVSGLETLDSPAPVLSAFGPTAAAFVRVVELGGPVAMRVLTAPEGDRWLVVGLAAP